MKYRIQPYPPKRRNRYTPPFQIARRDGKGPWVALEPVYRSVFGPDGAEAAMKKLQQEVAKP